MRIGVFLTALLMLASCQAAEQASEEPAPEILSVSYKIE